MNAHAKLPVAQPFDELSRANFDRLSRLINDHCGIQMPPSKRNMLETRLRRRARALGSLLLDEYCDYLFADANLAGEMPHLTNAVTTNKTDFFREPVQFDVLTSQILPEFVGRSAGAVRVWSAACSTGAEPYTLAMVLDSFAAQNPSLSYGILATDIDTDVLETARRGIYPRAMVDPVPPELRSAYVMEPQDPQTDSVRISPALRATVGFAQLNLMETVYPVGKPMDLIFCRNVLIYFNLTMQRKVVSRLVDNLAPGGYLFLGHAEGAAGDDKRLRVVSNTIYRRS